MRRFASLGIALALAIGTLVPVANAQGTGKTLVMGFSQEPDTFVAGEGGLYVTGVASNTISADEISNVFKSLPQVSQLKMAANSSPPGAKGSDVQSVSVNCQDIGGVLKGLDAPGKRTLGEAMLAAAGAAWPNASVSLLVSDPSGAGGQIIGIRAAGGTNTVIVS